MGKENSLDGRGLSKDQCEALALFVASYCSIAEMGIFPKTSLPLVEFIDEMMSIQSAKRGEDGLLFNMFD